MSSQSQSPAILFSTKSQVPGRVSRYTLADGAQPTAEGGTVGVGVDRNGAPFLVHKIGRTEEAIPLAAVATAVACGAIPVEAIVGAFREEGKLKGLADAVKAAQS